MYNIALIGMGNIGFLFDKDPNTKTALSHAKAIYLHQSFSLKYVADPCSDNLQDLKKLFPDVLYTDDYKSLLTFTDIDILIIAAPTLIHHKILMDFQENKNIKHFFMEKPLFSNKEEYQNIPLSLQEKIIINYPRRFEPNFQEIQKKLLDNPYGNIKKILIHYSKGFINNGSHALDFLNFLLGEFTLEEFSILDATQGFSEDDPTYDLFGKIKINNSYSNIHFIGFDHHHLTTLNIELYFEKAIIKYDDTEERVIIQEIKANPLYPTYLTAAQSNYSKKVMMDKIMLLAYNDLENKLSNKISFACTFDEEIKNTKFKNKILRK